MLNICNASAGIPIIYKSIHLDRSPSYKYKHAPLEHFIWPQGLSLYLDSNLRFDQVHSSLNHMIS